MTNNGLTNIFFRILDRITDIYPKFGPEVFEKIFLSVAGKYIILQKYLKKEQKKIKNIVNIKKILYIADINIGDTIITQSSINVILSYFPEAKMDFICNKKGGELIKNINNRCEILNIFGNSGMPSNNDLSFINRIIKESEYSFVINMSPFVKRKYLGNKSIILNLYVPFAYYVMVLLKKGNKNMNMSVMTHNFFTMYLKPFSPYNILKFDKKEKYHPDIKFNGNIIFISRKAKEDAKNFLNSNNIFSSEGLMLFNPIASSKFTNMPFILQKEIIEKCSESDEIKNIIICEDKIAPGIERKITKDISEKYSDKIRYLPFKIPLNLYAAIIDYCEVFISGDTGPVHIAAAKKVTTEEGYSMRNSTSVITIFGGTDSRIYGYDTDRDGHNPSNQNAPSKVFVGNAVCRNVSCINKLGKNCRNVRCFNDLSSDEISSYITSYFHHLNNLRKVKEYVKI